MRSEKVRVQIHVLNNEIENVYTYETTTKMEK